MRAIILALILILSLAACGTRDPYREILSAQPGTTATSPGWVYDTAPNAWLCTADQVKLDFFVGEVKEVIAYYQLAEHGATFRLFDLDMSTGAPRLVWEETPTAAPLGTWRELVADVRALGVRRGLYSVQVPHAGDKVSGLLVR